MGNLKTIQMCVVSSFSFLFLSFASTALAQQAPKQNQLKKLKPGNRLYWVACGKDDRLAYSGSQTLVALLEKMEIPNTFRESTGGHTWTNWRIYLSEMAPLLFR